MELQKKQFVTEPPVCISVNPSSLLMFNILLVKKALKSFASFLLQVRMNWEDLVSTIPHHIPSQSE